MSNAINIFTKLINPVLYTLSTFVILIFLFLTIPQQFDGYTLKASSDPSGQDMPVGDLSVWHQVFTDNFTTNVTMGNFPSAIYSKWSANPNGWTDTSGNGTYEPTQVNSISSGLLDWYIHTLNGVHMVSVPMPIIVPNGLNGPPDYDNYGNGQLYGRFTVRLRSDLLPGYKTAFLLWPNSENWPTDGEIDFPEGNLDDTSIGAYMHWQGGTSSNSQDVYSTTADRTAWHTYTIDWTPTAVTFYLDGTVIGQSTNSNHIPNTPMRWNLQVETSTDEGAPSNSTSGHIQVDWVAAYLYAPLPTPTLSSLPSASYNSSINLSGTKTSTITTVFVNGSSSGVSYPDSTHWVDNNFPLSMGSNTISIYGQDSSNNISPTSTTNISRHKLGDINGDDAVNLTDFSIFATDWMLSGNNINNSLSDMNSDGVVNLTDLSIFSFKYGS